MVKYELLIQDEAGDQAQFEYDPETDAESIMVRVRDIDGNVSIPVCINAMDFMALRGFMVLVRKEIMGEKVND